MKTNIKLAIFVLLFLPLFSAVAEDIPLDKIMVSTPTYQAQMDEFEPELGKYEFGVSWAGIPAATIYLDVNKSGPNYLISTSVKTAAAIRLFYTMKYEASSLMSGADLRPIKSKYYQKENSREKASVLEFLAPDRIISKYTRNGELKNHYDFNPNNMLLDPFSASFIARSLSWEPGTVRYFDTFNGKSRYLIEFRSVDKIKMEINNVMRDVWVVEPKVKKVSTTKDPEKLKEAKIYITADAKREIIQIKSDVFIGSVKTRLESFTPYPDQSRTLVKNSKTIEYNF